MLDDSRLDQRIMTGTEVKITARNVQVHYGTNHAIKDLNVDILNHTVTAFIGPSGCGKSTFLRCLNRMNDTIPICKVTGEIKLVQAGPRR